MSRLRPFLAASKDLRGVWILSNLLCRGSLSLNLKWMLELCEPRYELETGTRAICFVGAAWAAHNHFEYHDRPCLL
eukprot:1146793-Pelagomonas_calceolata.AAC.5